MHSLTAFLFATILALALAPVPQTQRKSPPQREKTECGTVISPEQIQAELARQKNIALAAAPIAPNLNDPIYLPLTIHMVCDRFGVGGFASPGEMEKTIEVLNQMWQPMGIQFFIFGGVDYSIHDDGFYYLPNDRAKQDALRKINSVPNTINVYFSNLNNIAGQGTFTSDSAQGVLLDYSAMSEYYVGIYKLEVFAHEMGHYFDLYHTHATDFGVECPSGNNCSTAGDRLCDTPADPKLDGFGFVDNNCAYTGTASTSASCDSTPYHPLTNNLMSYANGHCRNAFTSGQISKVLEVLNTASNRKGLLDGLKLYMDPQASNSNTQCTSTAPCRTVAKAVQAARDGAVIYLKPGVHPTSSVGGKKLTLKRWGNDGVAELRP